MVRLFFIAGLLFLAGCNKVIFDRVCIEGHKYYKQSYGLQGFMAIQLDSDGKPIKCKMPYDKNPWETTLEPDRAQKHE